MIRLAVAQYPIDLLDSLPAWFDKMDTWIHGAADAGAQILLFPEYAAMELTGFMAPEIRADLAAQIEKLQDWVEPYLGTYNRLCRERGLWAVAGSLPVERNGRYINRTYMFSPRGLMGFQDKLIMTRFEREEWNISPGSGEQIVDGPDIRYAVATCYDVEFPLLVHRRLQPDVSLLLVPSCTDTEAGATRVAVSARARALENQCFVAVATTWGNAEWSPALDINTGRAAVYVPPDHGFPASGVLAEKAADEPGWLFCDIDPARLEETRSRGQVRNREDWALQ